MLPPTHKTKILVFNFVHPKSNKTKPLTRFSKRYTFGASFNLFECFLKLSKRLPLVEAVASYCSFKGGGRAVVSMRQSCPHKAARAR